MREDWLFPDLQHFAVKIECKNEAGNKESGTGTIVIDNGHFYVLTAGHCICYCKCEEYIQYAVDEISIVRYLNSHKEIYSVQKIIACDFGDNDFAVLEIEKINDGFDYANKIKLAKMIIPNDTFLFVGYTEFAPEGRLFSMKKVGEKYMHLNDVQIDGQQCLGKELTQGCSGAGIFLYRHSRYYMLGYLTSIRDVTAAYSDFGWNEERVFNKFLSEDCRDDITIDMIIQWQKIEEKEVEKETMESLRLEQIEWMDNLKRKCGVLFPYEAEQKAKLFLNDYVRGVELFQCLKDSNPAFDEDLQLLVRKECEKNAKKMSIYYDDPHIARNDFNNLNNSLLEKVQHKFPEDNIDNDLSSSYVDYQLAYRLLNCSLNYKKYD